MTLGKRKFYALKTYYQRLSLSYGCSGQQRNIRFHTGYFERERVPRRVERDFEPVEFPQNGQDAL